MASLSARTALLLAIYSSSFGAVFAGSAGAQTQSATESEMSLYTRIGALNLCLLLATDIDYDRATAISGETIAQIIVGQNGSRIKQVGDKTISKDQLLRGSINSVVLGSIELCPDKVPAPIRQRVKSVVASQGVSPLPAPIDIKALSHPLESETPKAAVLNESVARPYQSITPARLALSITVKIETAGPSGSGTVISRDGDRYTVATACHVVNNAAREENLQIITADGERYLTKATSVKRYGLTDLCSVSFLSSKVYTVPTLSFRNAEIGDALYVSGWSIETQDIPAALRFTEGVVTGSATNTSGDGYSLIYTTKAPTLPGMSGGPILINNQLVGIHGRAERAPDVISEGKVLATTYSLGMSLDILKLAR